MKSDAPVISVVDDDEAVRTALSALGPLLNREVRTFASAKEFLADFDPMQPGCVVLDLRMPGLSGQELQQKLNQRPFGPPVIVISGHADVPTTVRLMQSGAVTVLEKPFTLTELKQQIDVALQRDELRRTTAARHKEHRARLDGLTEKEREVLEAVSAGRTNREIAEALGLSLRAVEDRRARLMRKFDAENIADLLKKIQPPTST